VRFEKRVTYAAAVHIHLLLSEIREGFERVNRDQNGANVGLIQKEKKKKEKGN